MLALQGSVGDCGGEKGIRSGGLRRKWGIGRSEHVNVMGRSIYIMDLGPYTKLASGFAFLAGWLGLEP